MNNREISAVFKKVARLMELHGENEFKTRSLANAAFRIDRLNQSLKEVPATELEGIEGIGKSISQKITLMLQTGTLPELVSLESVTPPGVTEILDIKGLGPKKVRVIWKDLGIESLGELLYACNENRLVELKGFGQKTQEQVRSSIEFVMNHSGWFLFAEAEKVANEEVNLLRSLFPGRVEITGTIRRKCETVRSIELLIETGDPLSVREGLINTGKILNTETDTGISYNHECGIPVFVQHADSGTFEHRLFLSTGSDEHLRLLAGIKGVPELLEKGIKTEADFYSNSGLEFIPPECREGGSEVERAKAGTFPSLIQYGDLKGCLHNHSTYSDGMNTLRQMAEACREMGLEYFGICDHSKSAFYANGMNEERIREQHREIDLLNSEMVPFRIFKGIESDILTDGALDYPDEILASFDFVVASVHSGLKMDREKATSRLLKAISNPFTTILGHPTSRLLLAREGYPLDMDAIIDSCAEHGVSIELNANPHRLDMDWKWIEKATSRGIIISVNPDAHRVERLTDMYYGVCVARKGFLAASQTLNCMTLDQIAGFFTSRRKMA